MKLLRYLIFLVSVFAIMVLQSCGAGVSSGDTTSGSLALSLDKSTVNCGDVVVATVTLTSTIAGRPVNDIKVWVKNVTDTNSIDESHNSGTTNSAGVATISLPANWIPADKGISLEAYADGATPSTSQQLTIVAPKLVLAMSASATWAPPNPGVVIQGNKATFLSQGLPVVGQPIILSVYLVDGWQTLFTVTLNGTKFSDSATPPETVTLNTDSSGTVNIPTIIEGTVPSNYDVYWRAVTTFHGVQYVASGSTLVTISATAPAAPLNVIATRVDATHVDVTFDPPASNGGSAITGYTVTSLPVGGTDANIGSTALTHHFSGLTTGTPYTFTVKATNAAGTSPASAASNSVTP